MFVVDLLSILPDKKKLIRDVFQNYWDFQDRWNRDAPEYARDMITVAIKTEPQEVRQFSQIPILAWGVERVYRRNGDKELLGQCLGRLERFHDWYWRERDLHDNGLITLGAYTGNLQHAKWETFDYACNLDGMRMTVHPKRKGPHEGPWYGDICVPGNTAYLILAERSLARLAETAGEPEMAARRRRHVEKGVKGMREHMWDEAAGTFLSVRRDTLEKIPVATVSSWIPLPAGAQEGQDCLRLRFGVEVLRGSHAQMPRQGQEARVFARAVVEERSGFFSRLFHSPSAFGIAGSLRAAMQGVDSKVQARENALHNVRVTFFGVVRGQGQVQILCVIAVVVGRAGFQ